MKVLASVWFKPLLVTFSAECILTNVVVVIFWSQGNLDWSLNEIRVPERLF